ncbi:hypothetical protein [Flagellimonas sp.]|uniref:hypothetical protein n=1 Tax=Flagellimonas sp. TaxID=2058762 RepID=UPI003B51628D
MEYKTGLSYSEDQVTDLIYNLKKSPLKKGRPEYKWKGWAIRVVIDLYRKIFSPQYLSGDVTLVPIPPSKAKGHAEYDDRMTKILKGICRGTEGDVRELITLTETIRSSHLSDDRPPPTELMRCLQIDEDLCETEPGTILLFDDMITTGSHFVACRRILQKRFPNAEIMGVFITRRIIEEG